MKRKMKAGSTSVMLPIFVFDSSKVDGSGLGSLAYNTANLVGEYRRKGANAWTAITLASGTLGTFASGGWVADGALAGAYEVGIPDAAVASGVDWVLIRYRGAANMAPVLIEIELDTIDYQVGNGKLPVTLASTDVTGNLPALVNSMASNVITASAVNSAALNGKGDWSTYAGGDTSGVTTLLGRLTSTRAGYLDRLQSGVPLAADGADSIDVETGINLPQAVAVILAACAGESSGVSTGSPVYKAAGNPGTTRITASASSGDRTSVSLNLP